MKKITNWHSATTSRTAWLEYPIYDFVLFNNYMSGSSLCERIDSYSMGEEWSQVNICQLLRSAIADIVCGWWVPSFWCWNWTQTLRSSIPSISLPCFFKVCETFHILVSILEWPTPSTFPYPIKACQCITYHIYATQRALMLWTKGFCSCIHYFYCNLLSISCIAFLPCKRCRIIE